MHRSSLEGCEALNQGDTVTYEEGYDDLDNLKQLAKGEGEEWRMLLMRSKMKPRHQRKLREALGVSTDDNDSGARIGGVESLQTVLAKRSRRSWGEKSKRTERAKKGKEEIATGSQQSRARAAVGPPQQPAASAARAPTAERSLCPSCRPARWRKRRRTRRPRARTSRTRSWMELPRMCRPRRQIPRSCAMSSRQ